MKKQVIVYKDKLRVEDFPKELRYNQPNLYKVRVNGGVGHHKYAAISKIYNLGGNRVVLLSRQIKEMKIDEFGFCNISAMYRTSCMNVDNNKFMGSMISTNISILPLLKSNDNDDCVFIEGKSYFEKKDRVTSGMVVGKDGAIVSDICTFCENNEKKALRCYSKTDTDKLNRYYSATMQLNEKQYAILLLNEKFDVVDIEKKNGFVPMEDAKQFTLENYALKYSEDDFFALGKLNLPSTPLIKKKAGEPINHKSVTDFLTANKQYDK